jgi:hypothetical protein
MSDAQRHFLELVHELVRQVTVWVEPTGWATHRYAKRMRAPDRSVFEIPALYLQRGPTRLLLDPVAFDVPGAEGLVDLYLMPTYDDMASLYLREGRWTIHYASPSDPTALPAIDKVEPVPLDQPNLLRILDTIASHATPSV